MEVETAKTVPVGFGKLLAHTDRCDLENVCWKTQMLSREISKMQTASARFDRTVRDRGFKKLKKWLKKNPDLGRFGFRKKG